MDGTTTTNDGPASDPLAADAPTAEQPQLLATSVGDTCANCGTRLAADQHYCVECGERRGKPRYALASTTAPTTAGTAPARSGARRRPRMSGNGTLALIAGVGVLLLAMGVGVLIGRTSNGSTNAARPQTIVIPSAGASGGAAAAGAAAAAAGAAGAAAAHNAARAAARSNGKTKTKPKVNLSKATQAKLKVIPKKLQSAVAKTGTKCAGGGRHTGTFFTPSGTNKTGCTK